MHILYSYIVPLLMSPTRVVVYLTVTLCCQPELETMSLGLLSSLRCHIPVDHFDLLLLSLLNLRE